ncbi:MAG: hypothetical protein ACREAC_20975, partial [Blastocatellia bacterium]
MKDLTRSVLFGQTRARLALLCLILTASASTPSPGLGQTVAPQSAGGLDSTFGQGGTVVSNFNDFNFGSGMAIQPDGKIVVAGFAGSAASLGAGDFTLDGHTVARYNTDGSLDQGFGVKGVVESRVGFAAFGMALQQDGKIVLVGAMGVSAASGSFVGTFALSRLNPDGSSDTSFGNSGMVVDATLGSSLGSSVTLQPDGKIVAAASQLALQGDSKLVRYDADGQPDLNFGTRGKVSIPGLISSIVLQPDGSIVGAGFTTGPSNLSGNLSVFRVNTAGSLDPGFGSAGVAEVSITGSDLGFELVLQTDGKIVIAGTSLGTSSTTGFELARLNKDGSIDTTFGIGGKVITQIGAVSFACSVALQADGKIVVAGSGGGSPVTSLIAPQSLAGVILAEGLGFMGSFAVARYNTDGTLDSTFGSGGTVQTSFPGQQGEIATAAAIQQDNKIIVSGYSGGIIGSTLSSASFALARYDAGSLVGDFALSTKVSSVSCGQGGTASVTIGVQTVAGSNPPQGPVSLSASVTETGSGITATFSPASVSAGAGSTCTIAAASTTPVGQYTISVKGAAGPIVHTINLTLDVAKPDFSLALTQSSVTVTPPTKQAVTVSIDRTGGFSGTVTVAPGSLPSGISVKGANQASTAGNSAAFKFKVK